MSILVFRDDVDVPLLDETEGETPTLLSSGGTVFATSSMIPNVGDDETENTDTFVLPTRNDPDISNINPTS